MEPKGIREEIQKRFETNSKGEFEKGFLLWICALQTLTRLNIEQTCANDGLIRFNKFVSRITDRLYNLFFY